MATLRVSQYNKIFSGDEQGSMLVFNCLTGAFASLGAAEFNEFEGTLARASKGELTDADRNDNLVSQMLTGGFLREEAFDEIAFLKVKNRMRRFSSKSLGLTIAPTMNCNFNCPYCFEDRKTGSMTENVRTALVNFVKRKIKDIDQLEVTWFGGEPLLAFNQIKMLTREFKQLCEDNNSRYYASMVTNGYALNPKVVSQFTELSISQVSVTVDGPRGIHDSRRHLKNGSPTFDIILNNLKAMSQSAKDVMIGLRVNVDRESIGHASEVLEILRSMGLEESVVVSFGLVEPTYACSSYEEACLSRSEFAQFEIEMFRKQLEEHYRHRDPFFPRPLTNFCTADLTSGFVIGPTGHLYKCWNDINRIEESVGCLDGDRVVQYPKLLKWLAWDPLEDDECLKCDILPVCMGGCPFFRFKQKTAKGPNQSCDERFKANFLERLRLRYQYRELFRSPHACQDAAKTDVAVPA